MKNILFLALILFAFQSFADGKARPGPHNKIGHTKKSEVDKKETFFYKLFNDELDIMGSSKNIESNDQILQQIEKLADLKDRGVISEAEFSDKKAILLDKIR